MVSRSARRKESRSLPSSVGEKGLSELVTAQEHEKGRTSDEDSARSLVLRLPGTKVGLRKVQTGGAHGVSSRGQAARS